MYEFAVVAVVTGLAGAICLRPGWTDHRSTEALVAEIGARMPTPAVSPDVEAPRPERL